jgi:DNA-binding response OmpR family regulator
MKRLLIVDDDQTVVDLLISVLSAEDRLIRYAYDGISALHWIEKEAFNLVISDLMMPKGHGFQLIEHVRANPDSAQTKILVLTAKSFRRDAEKALHAGADLVLSKPFEIEELKDKVNQLLS